MMEAVRTSETSVDNYFTRQYIPEDNSEHHTRRPENLKSQKVECLHDFQLGVANKSFLYILHIAQCKVVHITMILMLYVECVLKFYKMFLLCTGWQHKCHNFITCFVFTSDHLIMVKFD
jgi:hypothetical protein